MYGKKTGRAGQENKYDFPPPVDEILFFGPCVLIGTDPKTNSVVDLEIDDWEEIYEYLFGGFEDIGTEDSSYDEEDIATDDELDAIQKTTGTVIKQTKQGYAKDGFIVDDDEEDEVYEESDDDSDDSDKTPPKKVFTKNKKDSMVFNNERLLYSDLKESFFSFVSQCFSTRQCYGYAFANYFRSRQTHGS